MNLVLILLLVFLAVGLASPRLGKMTYPMMILAIVLYVAVAVLLYVVPLS